MADMSEHMEAFFGVNLEEKITDTLKELEEHAGDIKKISGEIREISRKISDDDIKNSLMEKKNILFDLGQQIIDLKLFFEFYFKKDGNNRHIVRERDTYMKLFQIMKWDTIDVRDLKRWLGELRELCQQIGLRAEDLVNFQRIASQPIPEEILKYPVYAMDKHGYCLTGSKWDEVKHEIEVREEMEERNK